MRCPRDRRWLRLCTALARSEKWDCTLLPSDFAAIILLTFLLTYLPTYLPSFLPFYMPLTSYFQTVGPTNRALPWRFVGIGCRHTGRTAHRPLGSSLATLRLAAPALCNRSLERACAREQVCESPCSANVSTSLPGTDCKLLPSSTPCKAPEHGALIHDQDSDALFAARVPGQAVPARVRYPEGSRESCWQVQVRASMTLPV